MGLTANDRSEIQDLTARYALAMDNDDLPQWLATWHPNGVWEGPRGTYAGRAQLEKLLDDLGERVRGKRHVISNHVIAGDATRATQTCYMLVIEAKAGGELVNTAVYHDVLIKTEDTWLFEHRHMKIDR